MTTITNQPMDKTQLDDAQTQPANQAMDGIKPTDINQDNNTTNDNNNESLLDMLCDAKSTTTDQTDN